MSARADPCGGRSAMVVPTATIASRSLQNRLDGRGRVQMRILILLLFIMLSFGFMGCTHMQQRTDQPEVDVGNEEASIRATDAQWLAAAKARDTEQAASFWSDDATI